jgi:ABC-type multidrug transport system fused ATPase/permease subunit
MSSTPNAYKPVSLRGSGDWRILVRCFRFLRPYWRMVLGSYLGLLLMAGMTVLIPQFIRWIIDTGIRAGNVRLLTVAVLILLSLTLLKGVIAYLQGRWTETASQSVAYDLRNAIHHRLAELSFAYHDRSESGQLLSRAVQDVERIRFLTGRAILRLVEGMVLLLATAVALVLMNPLLALLSLAAMPLLAWRALHFGRQMRPLSLAIQQQLGVLTTRLEQNLRGARVVKAFAQERAEIERFERENQTWFDLSAFAVRLRAVNVPMLDLIANIGTVFIIWYGGLLVIRGQLTLGELVAFSTYLGQLVMPVRRIGMIVPAVAMAASAGERVFDILDAPSPVQDADDAVPMPPINGAVRFEHVHFSYSERHSVLEDVTFEAQPGQVIALLGPTGSGKSSVLNLIPRFYDPTRGRVLIDGIDVRTVTLNSLRDQIGIVLQETTLFAVTVQENIAFGRPGASLDEIVAAAQAAQAHEFISAMPDGYQTRVGERGATLSGGQRQRIAISRALLKNPRILLLDDATASVDTETERQIQLALEQLMRGRTSFVIAQRLSTVRAANLILVLERGRIAAMGSHSQLLERSPLYAEIYERQLRPQEQDRQILHQSAQDAS